MMDLQIFQVAAFTDTQFGGNPAAVIPLTEWIDDALMQNIAAENNLSETAFLVPISDGQWHIRWFTPMVEVPLCGHATLASAAVIREQLGHRQWPIKLKSASGPLAVDIIDDWYALDFPANKPEPIDLSEDIVAALGQPVSAMYLANDIYLAVLESEAVVAALSPNFAALAECTEHGVIVTAAGDTVDFVSRFFAPAIGLNEDPVTGAAHCVLTPYWSARLAKSNLEARQISRRGGVIQCEDRGDRVGLRGQAVFFLSGQISLA
jgi:PhzF family phenazine biosynthesis protein